jgi:hypothetical protein
MQHKTNYLGINTDQRRHFIKWFLDRQWMDKFKVIRKTRMFQIVTQAYVKLATISPITIAGPPHNIAT